MGGDNVLNSPGLMDPSTEFGSMMQHAMKIKGAQMEQDRKKFEVWPQFLQNSMWERNETTLKLRELPPAERLAGAGVLKEEGNELFKKKKYTSAVELYEAATWQPMAALPSCCRRCACPASPVTPGEAW